MLELLHVPARFGPTQPELAALALALCSSELRAQGDKAGAEALRKELSLAAPGSAALAWLDAQTTARAEPPAGAAR